MTYCDTNLLPIPAAKKRHFFKRDYPFPIINSNEVAEFETDSTWKYIEGYLQENCVLVQDEENMKLLYNKGFFGKGTLSRNAPQICFGKRFQSSKRKETPKEPVQKIIEAPKECSSDDIIEVVDSDDDGPKLKKNKKSDDVEVVLSDTSSSSEEDSHDEGNKDKTDPSRDLEPPEKEALQLTFQEAYFLSYGLGCLVVKENDQALNLARLWSKFCELTPDERFPIMYAAYHHFRSKGWIVKSGIKYGVDYVLYKDGPPFYHATYSVIVKPVKEQGLRDVRGNKHLTWGSLAALSRVNSASGKDVMFLYVIIPNSMSANKVLTPFCISQYKVEEVLVKRWVPEENREENKG